MKKNQTVVLTPQAQEIADLQAKIKALKAEAKPEKKVRELKGVKVRFQTKSGETVEGLGVLYYVARMNGKLYYKEASNVELITD